MNKTVRDALMFAAGVVIGAVVTNIVLKNKYDRILYDDVSEDYETYKKALDKDEEAPVSESEVDENGMPIKKLVVPGQNYKRIVRRYVSDEADDYDPVESEGPPEDTSDEDYLKCEKMSHEANHYDSDKEPYVISIEQFSEEKDHYDKLTIMYYEGDDTLADEEEEIIAEVEEIIGPDALHCFGDESDDPDVVYIRNERLCTDYEVIRTHKGYGETVGGVVRRDGHDED